MAWPPTALLGVVALAGGLLDARRHLWRMGFAMWVAAVSICFAQPRVFQAILGYRLGLRAIPVIAVMVVVVYWLVRTMWQCKRAAPKLDGTQAWTRRHDPPLPREPGVDGANNRSQGSVSMQSSTGAAWSG